jgi:hypothetical protein
MANSVHKGDNRDNNNNNININSIPNYLYVAPQTQSPLQRQHSDVTEIQKYKQQK